MIYNKHVFCLQSVPGTGFLKLATSQEMGARRLFCYVNEVTFRRPLGRLLCLDTSWVPAEPTMCTQSESLTSREGRGAAD